MYGLLSSQDFDKLVDAYHVDVGKWCLFENIVVMVFCYDVAGISLESAVNKLVIIGICRNKMKMIIHLNHLGVGQVKDSGYNIRSNLRSHFLSENLLILSKNLISDKACTSRQRNHARLDSRHYVAKETSADSWYQEQYSLLLVWRAHVFRLPLFHHVVVEHTFIP